MTNNVKNTVSKFFGIDNAKGINDFIRDSYVDSVSVKTLNKMLHHTNHAFVDNITATEFIKKCDDNDIFGVKEHFNDYIINIANSDKHTLYYLNTYIDDDNILESIVEIMYNMLSEQPISMKNVYHWLDNNNMDNNIIEDIFEVFVFDYFNRYNKEIMVHEDLGGVIIVKKFD